MITNFTRSFPQIEDFFFFEKDPGPAFKKTEKGLQFEIDLPGRNLEDMDITINGHYINVIAKKTENRPEYRTKWSLLNRDIYSISMDNLKRISASYVDGVLSILIPNEIPQSKKIPISGRQKEHCNS